MNENVYFEGEIHTTTDHAYEGLVVGKELGMGIVIVDDNGDWAVFDIS